MSFLVSLILKLNKFNILSSLLVQICTFNFLFLVTQYTIEITTLLSSIIFFILAIFLVFLLFKLNSDDKQRNMIGLIVLKFSIALMIIFLPVYQNIYTSMILKAAFVGKLVSTTKIKAYKNPIVKTENQVELIFIFLMAVVFSFVFYLKCNQEESFIVIVLLFEDVLLKLITFISRKRQQIIQESQKQQNRKKSSTQTMTFRNQKLEKNGSSLNKYYADNNFDLSNRLEASDHILDQKFLFEIQEHQSDKYLFREILPLLQEGIVIVNKEKEVVYSSSNQLQGKKQSNEAFAKELMQLVRYDDSDIKKELSKSDSILSQQIGAHREVSCSASFLYNNLDTKIKTLADAIDLMNSHYNDSIQKNLLITPRMFDIELLFTEEKYIQKELDEIDYFPEKMFKIFLKPVVIQNELLTFLQIQDISYKQKIKQLEASIENKINMISHVSHEFRTPLNCIILLIQELMEKSSAKVIEDYLEPVMISGQSLLSLIQDLLDISQIRVGKFQIFIQNFNLFELIDELRKLLTPSLALKQNLMQIEFEDSVPEYINSDINRVSNASKFTNNGIITIKLRKISDKLIQISVIDTGIGIKKENQNKLFKAFAKIEETLEMNIQGVGLGLLISNILADKLVIDRPLELKGNFGLQLSSEGYNKGATFSFIVQDIQDNNNLNKNMNPNESNILLMNQQFKLAEIISESRLENKFDNRIPSHSFQKNKQFLQLNKRASIISLQSQKSSFSYLSMNIKKEKFRNIRESKGFSKLQPESSGESLKMSYEINLSPICNCYDVLAIDDEALNILALTTLLKKYPLKIDSTTNPLEAIEKAKKYNCIHKKLKNFLVILMDLEMPLMDGYELTKQILKHKPNSYIIGISGHSPDLVLQDCLKCGMKDLIQKPVKRGILQDSLTKALGCNWLKN